MSLQSRNTEVELFKGFKYAGKFFSRNTGSDVESVGMSPQNANLLMTDENGTLVEMVRYRSCR